MALVLPLLLLVLFGVIDFGRMLNTQLVLTEAAREGARAAALGLDADARVPAASVSLKGVTDSVTTCPGTGSTTADATVTSRVTFTFVTPFAAVAPLFGGHVAGSVPMTGQGVMPCIG
jgi:Flp pilus assembly protein TadG